MARRFLARTFELTRSGVGVALVVGFVFADALGEAADVLRGHGPIRDPWGPR